MFILCASLRHDKLNKESSGKIIHTAPLEKSIFILLYYSFSESSQFWTCVFVDVRKSPRSPGTVTDVRAGKFSQLRLELSAVQEIDFYHKTSSLLFCQTSLFTVSSARKFVGTHGRRPSISNNTELSSESSGRVELECEKFHVHRKQSSRISLIFDVLLTRKPRQNSSEFVDFAIGACEISPSMSHGRDSRKFFLDSVYCNRLFSPEFSSSSPMREGREKKKKLQLTENHL